MYFRFLKTESNCNRIFGWFQKYKLKLKLSKKYSLFKNVKSS